MAETRHLKTGVNQGSVTKARRNMGVRRLLDPLEVWGMTVGRQETVGVGEPGDWDDGESGRNGEGATSLWVSQKAWRGITVHELGKNCALAGKECRAESTGGLNLRRPLTICTRGPDSWGAADSIFRGAGPRCMGPMESSGASRKWAGRELGGVTVDPGAGPRSRPGLPPLPAQRAGGLGASCL